MEEKEAVAGVEWEEEVHPVIINYDVLEKIFSFLTPKDVKEARLVCKVWGTVGNKELGNKTFLVINKLDLENLEDGEIPTVHPHFVQRIKIHFERGLTENSPKAVDHFLPFLTFHRTKIEELLFEGQDYFLGPFNTVLEAVEFPKLEKISLHELVDEEGEVLALAELQIQRLSVVLNTVKKLELWPSERTFQEYQFTNERNFPLFQEIINKCPNLEGLKVFRQFYPNLSSCVNLKSLEWVGPTSQLSVNNGRTQVVYHGRHFHIRMAIRVLIPIKDSLEYLSLGSLVDQEADGMDLSRLGDSSIRDYLRRFSRTRNPLYRNPVEYPSMPKLTSLFVSDVNLFGQAYHSFNQNQFPALKNLTLRSTKKYEFPIIKFLSDCSCVNNAEVKMESLSLNQVPLEDVKVWEVISATFPNLKELSLGLTTKHEMRDLTTERVSNPGRLKNTLTAVSRNIVNLEKLTLEIKFACTFYGLMDGICVNDFEHNNLDSKKVSLKLVAPDPRLITDDGRTVDESPMIWESILIYKSLTFQGFGVRVRADTRKQMRDFVVERDLKNVYFLQ